ncbi:hypothetical protein [Escherichia coli]
MQTATYHLHQNPMQFHLKTSEVTLAAVNRKQPDHLFRSLGFNRTWEEWQREEDARTHTTERRHDRGWSQECEQYFVLFNIVMFVDVHRQG